jgi:hypothetical protein
MKIGKSKKSNENAETKKVVKAESPMTEEQKSEVAEKINSTAKKMAEEDKAKKQVEEMNSLKDGVSKSPKSAELDDETKKQVNEGMRNMIEMIGLVKDKSRYFRERIDYIMKVISFTGIQAEIATKIKSFNPIEHTLVQLTLAKGSFGEILKVLVPKVELVGLRVHDMFEIKPEGFYPYIKGEYMANLHLAIHDVFDGKYEGTLLSEDQVRLIESYAKSNPYTHPKQKGSDVEPVANESDIETLNIQLPKSVYKDFRGNDINHASQLNHVQMVDWIKGMLSDLIDEYIKFKFATILKSKMALHSKYKDENVDVNFIAIIHAQAVYNNLISAKNLFGYTFQYVK